MKLETAKWADGYCIKILTKGKEKKIFRSAEHEKIQQKCGSRGQCQSKCKLLSCFYPTKNSIFPWLLEHGMQNCWQLHKYQGGEMDQLRYFVELLPWGFYRLIKNRLNVVLFAHLLTCMNAADMIDLIIWWFIKNTKQDTDSVIRGCNLGATNSMYSTTP